MLKLVKGMVSKETAFITLIYGEDTSLEKAEAVHAQLRAKYPGIDITLVNGGQPIYYYIVSVE